MGSSSPYNRPHTAAAPIATRSMQTINGRGIPGPGPSRLPTSSAAIHSRPGPAAAQQHEAARNFSRLQAASAAAAPTAAVCPSMRGRAVREVGFDNWAIRHESIAALPAPARGQEYAAAAIVRSYRGRVPSAIREEDEPLSPSPVELLSARPSTVSTPTASETQTATIRWQWQGERAKRSPALVLGGAAPIRSQAASLVAATESVPSMATVAYMRPATPTGTRHRPVPLPSSPLRPLAGPVVEDPRTFLEMHANFERPSTRREAHVRGPELDWGENFSPFARRPVVADVRRRVGLGRQFPVPGNAREAFERGRERVFSAAFVDAPRLVGGGSDGRGGPQRGSAVLATKSVGVAEMGGSEAVAAPEGGDEVVTGEKKKRWQRISAFLSRKMRRKEKGGSSSFLALPSPATLSPRTIATPPSLVWVSSSNASPGPATPPRAYARAPVVVPKPPYPTPCKTTEEKQALPTLSPSERSHRQSVSPLSSAPRAQIGVSLARAAASVIALCREHDREPAPSLPEEEQESPLEELDEVDDEDLFPSPLVAGERWARSQEGLHAAVAEAMAEEEAAADWSGMLERTERVEYVGKGKAKVVDVRDRPSRYRGRRVGAAEAPSTGSPGDGKARRDTLDEKKGKDGERGSSPWPLVEGLNSRGPVVAVSGLRK